MMILFNVMLMMFCKSCMHLLRAFVSLFAIPSPSKNARTKAVITPKIGSTLISKKVGNVFVVTSEVVIGLIKDGSIIFPAKKAANPAMIVER